MCETAPNGISYDVVMTFRHLETNIEPSVDLKQYSSDRGLLGALKLDSADDVHRVIDVLQSVLYIFDNLPG